MKKIFIKLMCLVFVSVMLFASCNMRDKLPLDDTESDIYTESFDTSSEVNTETALDENFIKYEEAIEYLNNGEIESAYDIFLTLRDYRDANEYLECFSFKYSAKIQHSPNLAESIYYEYDGYGRILTELYFSSYGSFRTYTYKYDQMGNLIERKYLTSLTDIKTDLYEHDDAGNLIRHIDRSGNIATIEYDENGNAVKRMEFHANSDTPYSILTYEYDSDGNCVKKSERNNTYDYNHVITYEYDKNGNVIQQITDWGDSSLIITNQYNEDDKLIQCYKKYSSGIWHLYNYEYDINGNLIKSFSSDFSDSWNIYTWKYDESGNLIREDWTRDGTDFDYIYKYEYDELGNKIKFIQSRGGSTWITLYEYDEYGNVIKEIAPGETSSEDDYWITSYEGYRLYYNPYKVSEDKNIYPDFGGKG